MDYFKIPSLFLHCIWQEPKVFENIWECIWTVPEDTVPTNVYTSSYLRHRTVQYGVRSLSC